MPNIPVRHFRCAITLAPLMAIGIASATPAPPTGADALRRDLTAILECRASPAARQAVGNVLRAAMYGDVQKRPVYLRGWTFTRSDNADSRLIHIEMPLALTAHGIATHRFMVDAMDFSMPITVAQREQIVVSHALRLRTTVLQEPFQVWSAAGQVDAAPLDASIVVQRDGDGFRLGCDMPGPEREARIPERLRDVADAQDLSAALECRADDQRMQRIANLWERLSDYPAWTWPSNVVAIAELGGVTGDEDAGMYRIVLDPPLLSQGMPVRAMVMAYGGFIGGDMGNVLQDDVLRAAGLSAKDRTESSWQREVLRTPIGSHFAWTRTRVVARAGAGALLSGCISARVNTVDR
jgi:hypothetical protein